MNTVTSSVEFLMVINPVFYKRKKFVRVEIYKKKREYSVIQKDKKHIQVSNFISSKSKINKQYNTINIPLFSINQIADILYVKDKSKQLNLFFFWQNLVYLNLCVILHVIITWN